MKGKGLVISVKVNLGEMEESSRVAANQGFVPW